MFRAPTGDNYTCRFWENISFMFGFSGTQIDIDPKLVVIAKSNKR